MSAKISRSRNDPRRDATRTALIETAEAMFGEWGIEAVSLRQIGTAIGSANTNVVAYHFGSKEALVEAIFLHRLPALEARRAELLSTARLAGQIENMLLLMEVLWRPFLEQTDAQGRHSYAAFQGALLRSNLMMVRAALDEAFPVTREIVKRIGAALPKKSSRERLQICTYMMIGAFQRIDFMGKGAAKAEAVFMDALRMAAAALTAPAD